MSEAHTPFAPPVYMRCIMDCLNSIGLQPSTVLRNVGLAWQDLCDGERMVDLEVFRRFVAYAIRCSGEPNLGLIAGSMLQPYHTPVGIGAVTSDSLGQGLRFLSRYAKLIFCGLEFDLEIDSRAITLIVRPALPLCEINVFITQTILGAHCRLLEAILGRHADELAVGLPYSRPEGRDVACLRYVRRACFDQNCLWLELPAALLRTRCIGADARAFSDATQVCQELELESIHGAFVQSVRRALVQRLAFNPDAAALALALGISAKTLTRRLSGVGMTYSEIKDELRRTRATWYLQHTELSIEGIASQLGYADPTNFTRKFKDWYQVAPSKMRRAMQMESR